MANVSPMASCKRRREASPISAAVPFSVTFWSFDSVIVAMRDCTVSVTFNSTFADGAMSGIGMPKNSVNSFRFSVTEGSKVSGRRSSMTTPRRLGSATDAVCCPISRTDRGDFSGKAAATIASSCAIEEAGTLASTSRIVSSCSSRPIRSARLWPMTGMS